jgi:hypothetical protein
MLFLVVGVAIVLGFDRDVQTWVIDNGWYDPVKGLEDSLN